MADGGRRHRSTYVTGSRGAASVQSMLVITNELERFRSDTDALARRERAQRVGRAVRAEQGLDTALDVLTGL